LRLENPKLSKDDLSSDVIRLMPEVEY